MAIRSPCPMETKSVLRRMLDTALYSRDRAFSGVGEGTRKLEMARYSR